MHPNLIANSSLFSSYRAISNFIILPTNLASVIFEYYDEETWEKIDTSLIRKIKNLCENTFSKYFYRKYCDLQQGLKEENFLKIDKAIQEGARISIHCEIFEKLLIEKKHRPIKFIFLQMSKYRNVEDIEIIKKKIFEFPPLQLIQALELFFKCGLIMCRHDKERLFLIVDKLANISSKAIINRYEYSLICSCDQIDTSHSTMFLESDV